MAGSAYLRYPPSPDEAMCRGGGWDLDFLATGRFVHTALTDQTLNTNIYDPWLLFITVVVVVVIVVDVYVFFK